MGKIVAHAVRNFASENNKQSIIMDYEQDYSKLTSSDNHWYNCRQSLRTSLAQPTEEESPSTTLVTLDNEDFN